MKAEEQPVLAISSHRVRIYGNVPVALCSDILRLKRVPTFKLYLALKYLSTSGYIDPQKARSCAYTYAGIRDFRTFEKHLGLMLEYQWITVPKHKNVYFIRGFKAIYGKNEWGIKSGVPFYENDFDTFNGFIYAAAIVHTMLLMSENPVTISNHPRMTKGRPLKDDLHSESRPNSAVSYSYPRMPVRYLAKALKVSQTTAHRYLEVAGRGCYLSRERMFERFEDHQARPSYREFKTNRDGIDPQAFCSPSGTWFRKDPDYLHLEIKPRRKRNMR